jgi:hypothetical protein
MSELAAEEDIFPLNPAGLTEPKQKVGRTESYF